VKSGTTGAVTAIDTVTVWLNVPLTPVIVSEYEPAGVLEPVVTVKVDEPVAGFALKDPAAPAGSPLMLRFTWLVKPFNGVIVTL